MSQLEPRIVRGRMHGQTILLDEDLGLPDGTQVFVTVEAVPTAPLSDEDRAILEHVYQERGCGVERDC
ncbi:MAG: hypothetical protein SFU86_04225 [Pirellulaceae bacterium]|nr:hypothetical protein [Pirellulaceae bacterium]